MRKIQAALLLLLITLPLSGCELIGDLVEFGVWVALIFIALIVLVAWGIRRAFARRTPPPPPGGRM